jgi:hypothetical protein
MADAPPPRKDRQGAISKLIVYTCIIVFGIGAIGLDDPTYPDQYLSPLYWGRRVHQGIANFFRETP